MLKKIKKVKKEVKTLDDGSRVVLKVEKNIFKRLLGIIDCQIKEGITLGEKYRKYRYFQDYRVGTTWKDAEGEDVKLIGKTSDAVTLLLGNELQLIIVK